MIRGILGDAVYGTDATTFEESIVQTLTQQGKTVAVAESLTGGGVGARLTSVPGSSKAFAGGVIAYTANAKTNVLGIPADLIATHGPVSPEVATAMAEAARHPVRRRLWDRLNRERGANRGVSTISRSG